MNGYKRKAPLRNADAAETLKQIQYMRTNAGHAPKKDGDRVFTKHPTITGVSTQIGTMRISAAQ